MRTILRIPVFPDDELNNTAGLLHRIVIAILCTVSMTLVFVLIMPESALRWVLTTIGVYLWCLPLIVLNRAGRTRLASILLIGGLWAGMSFLAYSANGIRSVAIVVFLLIIFMAGILLGGRAGILTAVLCSLSTLALTLLELAGLLPPSSVTHSPISLWTIHTLLAAMVVFLQYVATHSIANALKTAKDELAERRKVESALRESEARYRALVDHSPDAVVVVQNERIAFLNPAAAVMLKADEPSTLIGRHIDEFLAHESREPMKQKLHEVLSSGTAAPIAEWKVLRLDGRIVDVEGTGAPVMFNGARAVLSSFRDITEKVKAEEALRSSEELLSFTFEMNPDAMVISRLSDGEFIRWNASFAEQVGLGDEEIRGRSALALGAWATAGEREHFLKELHTRGEVRNTTVRVPRRSGKGRTILLSSRKSNFQGEDIILTVGRDMTERMEMEEKLKSSEERYRRLYENILEGFVSVTMDGRIRETNEAYRTMLGYTEAELAGLTYSDITPEKWHAVEAQIVASEVLPWGVSRVYEKEYRRKDGAIVPIELRTYLIRGDDGEPTGMWAFVRDITERKRGEDILRMKDRALESSINGIAIADLDGTITYVNPAFLSMWGYDDVDEVLGRNGSEFWTEPDRATHVMRQLLVKGADSGEMTALRKGGSTFDVELSASTIPGQDGRPLYILGAFIDITERKKKDLELKHAKEFAENLIQTADAIVVGLDLQGRVQIFNSAAERITGYASAELMGKNWFERIVPEEKFPYVWEEFKKLPAGTLAREFENPILTKDGNERIIAWRNSELKDENSVVGSVSFGIDVTEQRKVERELRQSEQRLRQVIDLVPQFIFAKNRKGQFILVNKAVAEAYGTSVEGLLGKTDADFNPDQKEVEHFILDDNEVMDSGMPKVIPEEVITDSTGQKRFLQTIKIPYRVAAGSEDAVLGVSADITDRKLAEQTLKESEEQFRSLAEESPNMIFINQGGDIVYANRRCEDLMGYTREQLMAPGFDFRSLIAPDSLERIGLSFSRHARGEEVPPYEYGLLTREAKRIDAIITTKLIRYKNAPAILGIVTDISERKKNELELIYSRERLRDLSNRLQAIREEESRRIAREIHDELGQTLTALKMDHASLEEEIATLGAPRNVTAESTMASMAGLIDSAIRSVRRIGSELRPVALDSLGLVAAIEWLAGDFAQRTGVKCAWIVPQDDLEIDRERSTAIFRILQESLTNITRHAGATEVRVSFQYSRGVLELRIEDNGRGMEYSDRPRSGSFGILGMRERASLFGGTITFTSNPGKGTVVHARIPVDDPKQSSGEQRG